MISIRTYGNYKSDNYGSHCLQLRMAAATLYYSYKTVIAFRAPNCGLVVSVNCWGPTTGKHLNAIDGGEKKFRKNREEFEQMLQTHVYDKLTITFAYDEDGLGSDVTVPSKQRPILLEKGGT